MKKYVLTNEVNEARLHRIVAFRDIPRYGIKTGDLGGFVESEKNLSQEGDCWVDGNACVYENSHISDNAYVTDKAKIFGNACIFNNAYVFNNTLVCENACVFGNAEVFGDVQISGDARIYGNARIKGTSSGGIYIFNETHVSGDTYIFGDVKISSKEDYITFQNWWGSENFITWTRSDNMWRSVLFYGTAKELLAKAEKEGERSFREYKRLVEYVENILKDESSDKKKMIHRDSKGRFCKVS